MHDASIRFGALLTGALLSVSPLPADTELTYEAVFDATWSAQTHPVDFPGNAHFSPPIGVVHDSSSRIWQEGTLASPGIERLAEDGLTPILEGEMLAVAVAGHASAQPFFGLFLPSPGQTTSTFTASPTFDHVSWVSMLAPSPDWFAGVDSFPLHANDTWVQQVVLPLYAYDAGTDDGATFAAPNAEAQPHQPVARIVTAPLAPTGDPVPVGTLTLTLLAVDDSPPGGDPDGDGLTNLEEAGLGTDPLLPDSDGDGAIDGVDLCPTFADPAQLDLDGDRVGDLCDVCPADADPSQRDADGDGEGDVCDVDDGILRFSDVTPSTLSWHDEPVFDRFHLYRGDLAVLRASGGMAATQPPDGAAAARFCDLSLPASTDGFAPLGGAAVFYLVTGESSGVEVVPGLDSAGAPRSNLAPCPP